MSRLNRQAVENVLRSEWALAEVTRLRQLLLSELAQVGFSRATGWGKELVYTYATQQVLELTARIRDEDSGTSLAVSTCLHATTHGSNFGWAMAQLEIRRWDMYLEDSLAPTRDSPPALVRCGLYACGALKPGQLRPDRAAQLLERLKEAAELCNKFIFTQQIRRAVTSLEEAFSQ